MIRMAKQVGPAAVALLFALPASAHHSTAMYDTQRKIRLEGTVTRFDWTNPHVYISVKTDAGEDTVWTIELVPPAVMSKSGWSATSLAPGDRIVALVSPAKNPARRMVLGSPKAIKRADGTPLAHAVAAEPPPSTVAASLSGQWLPVLKGFSLYAELAGDRRPTSRLTAKGVAAIKAYDASADPLNYECSVLLAPYAFLLPRLTRIEIGQEETRIRVEGGTSRTIHMNVPSHEGAEDTVEGHSIGRWEGDVLVVDTANYAPYVRGHGRGLPSGRGKHLVERFELNEDRTALTYTFKLEDPEYLAEPVTATLQMRYRPDLKWSSEPCDPAIARRPLEQ